MKANAILAPIPQAAPAHPIARRRLASNVVCLFMEDQPAPKNTWRGRYPKNVVRLFDYRRISEGCIAEFFGDCYAPNRGKLVHVLEGVGPEGRVSVRAIVGVLERVDGSRGKQATTDPKNLRRVWQDCK